MKINSVDELKQFLLWAKSQKIVKVGVDNIEIQFSELAFIDSPLPQDVDLQSMMPSSKTWTDVDDTQAKMVEKEDEDLLFWSAKG